MQSIHFRLSQRSDFSFNPTDKKENNSQRPTHAHTHTQRNIVPILEFNARNRIWENKTKGRRTQAITEELHKPKRQSVAQPV